MVCTCGKRLPVTNRYSICDRCLNSDDEDSAGYHPDAEHEIRSQFDDWDDEEEDDWDDEDESN